MPLWLAPHMVSVITPVNVCGAAAATSKLAIVIHRVLAVVMVGLP